MKNETEAYNLAQRGMADLKTAVHMILIQAESDGLKNAEIGRKLGIYGGHDGQHQGHISRTILSMLGDEGVADQDKDSKKWKIK